MPENIRLQITEGAGAPQLGQDGGVQVTAESTLQLSVTGATGAKTAKYRIYEYPDGYALPAGWTLEGNAYVATVANAGPSPTFEAPAAADWGGFLADVEVDERKRRGQIAEDLYDNTLGFYVASSTGIPDVLYMEDKQFDQKRQWAGRLKQLVRFVDGFSFSATPDGTISPAKLDANAGGYPGYTALRAALTAGSHSSGATVRTAFRTSNGDGGEGEWRVVAIGSYVDNGGTILTGGSFAALRKYDGLISVKWFEGVSGSDYTTAINAAFAAVVSGKGVTFPPGAYSYTPGTSELMLGKDDCVVEFQEGAIITLLGSATSYRAFYFKVCDRLHIKGRGRIIGRSATTTGILLQLEGSIGAHVDPIRLESAGSDAIYITRATSNQATNHVIRANIDGAARNGITVVSCDGIEISGEVRNVNGDPGAGLQFEPNDYTVDLVTNFKVHDFTAKTCTGNGIGVSGLNNALQAQQGIGHGVIDGVTTQSCGSSAATNRESGVSVTFARGVQVMNHVSKSDRVGFRAYLAPGTRYQGRVESSVSNAYRIQDSEGVSADVDAFSCGAGGLIDGFSRAHKIRGAIKSCTGDGLTLNTSSSECDVQIVCRENSGYGIANAGATNSFFGCDLRAGGSSGALNDTGYGSNTSSGAMLTTTNYVSSTLTGWTADELTVTGGQNDPFGGTSAYNLVDTVVNGQHRIYTTPTGIDAGADAVMEFYAKANTVSSISLTMDNGTSVVTVDLSNGTIAGTAVDAKASGPLGNGWYAYRIVFPDTKISGTANSVQFYLPIGIGTVQGVLVCRFKVTQS